LSIANASYNYHFIVCILSVRQDFSYSYCISTFLSGLSLETTSIVSSLCPSFVQSATFRNASTSTGG
jgi:hypothetical protein